jgi:hypothetical protein
MSTIAERISANTDMPFNVRKAFNNAGEPEGWSRPWVLMWRECAARAVMDALGYTGQTEIDKHNAIMLEAQRWFKYAHDDMREVFELAEVPLEITRVAVIENFPLTKKMPKIRRDSKKRKTR